MSKHLGRKRKNYSKVKKIFDLTLYRTLLRISNFLLKIKIQAKITSFLILIPAFIAEQKYIKN